jgi:hypothetical protein
MLFSDSEIKFFAKRIGMHPKKLKAELMELNRQFRGCAYRRDWRGCLQVIQSQNTLDLLQK